MKVKDQTFERITGFGNCGSRTHFRNKIRKKKKKSEKKTKNLKQVISIMSTTQIPLNYKIDRKS